MKEKNNPFNITKASDFTDEQIKSFWVEYPGGFEKIMKPTSPMPMIIRGGKGSGKTHLMRQYSFPLQKLRHTKDLLEGITKDGYLGIYMVCGGINANRFYGKGQSTEIWNSIFAYYMDIWLSQMVLKTTSEIYTDNNELKNVEKKICSEILNLFDSIDNRPNTLIGLLDLLVSIQKSIDFDVNNCAITKKLETRISVSPAKLIFGIPKILKKLLPSMKKILFVYLIDEFENLQEEQQKYINTLVRERQSPSTLKIGGRKYGFRTKLTLSAGEDIKKGSEFELLELDVNFQKKKEYKKFIDLLCTKRLTKNDFIKESSSVEISNFFDTYLNSPFEQERTKFIIKKYDGQERPYFSSLKSKLRDGFDRFGLSGISKKAEIDGIIERLSVKDYPLVEKFNVFQFYQSWSQGKNLKAASIAISKECIKFINKKDGTSSGYGTYSYHFNYWKEDLLIQLFRECDQRTEYVDFSTFIELSHGLPRNLLIILKNIYRWSEFNNEKPFQGGKISIDAQTRGVQEASEWFYSDARGANEDGRLIRDSISRLGELFRACLFSDKPVEVSSAGFSYDPSKITAKAQRIIDLAEEWSLLVKIQEGEKNRNSTRIDSKYVLNKMISPLWQLPVARRGTILFVPEEVNAIFDPEQKDSFKELLNKRLVKMNAPFKKTDKSYDLFGLFK